MVMIADETLSSAQVIGALSLNLLYRMVHPAVTLLNTKIHIPITSDILNTIKIPEIPLLELFCWIVAAAYTIPYKVASGRAH
jgi:hypothetical protein